MRIGNFSFHLISDGAFLRDGGCMFGQVPKVTWEEGIKPDRRNRIRLGVNSLLIQTPNSNILVDTGAGAKEAEEMKETHGLSAGKLLKRLKDLGLTTRDIDTVILTHLHFDHCGGSTRQERTGKAAPTFPKAKYLIQKEAWEEACSPNERGRDSFHPDDFMPLMEKGRVSLIDGDYEVMPGVWTKNTGGHCRGHQVVTVNPSGERIAFLGDLIPTSHHIPLSHISSYDHSPEDTLAQKRMFLEMAQEEGWLLIFGHGIENSAGYVDRRNGETVFRPVEV